MGSASAMNEPSSGLCSLNNHNDVEVKKLCARGVVQLSQPGPRLPRSFTLLPSHAHNIQGHELGRALPQ